jgi:hypothetical protein
MARHFQYAALALLLCFCLPSTVQADIFELHRDSIGQLFVVQLDASAAGPRWGPEVAAVAIYNKTLNQTGWDYLHIRPSAKYFAQPGATATHAEGYKMAGYLEGYITADRIWDSYVNQVQGIRNMMTPEEKAFIERHMMFMSKDLVNDPSQIAKAPLNFVSQLEKIWAQLEGLQEGYAGYLQLFPNVAGSSGTIPQPLGFFELFLISFQSEFWDVMNYLNAINMTTPRTEAQLKSFASSLPQNHADHCSGLIKPVVDKNGNVVDLFVSHDTWNAFNAMLRQYKTYEFDSTVVMSSYPGMLVSMDDWYMTSRGLAVQETTNGVSNMTLYKDYFSAERVSEWIRVMIANYVTESAADWTQYFVYLNSGSYNNQWMAVDMKLFTPGVPLSQLPDGLLWVSETIPGFAPRADVTDVLRQQGYWASYNIPYFPEIYALSGYPALEKQYGTYYSYTKYARPEIFKRNHTMVTDLESMKALMRYNDYQNDPLSDIPNCNGTIYNNTCRPKRSAVLAVAARGDLDPVGNASTMGPLAAIGGVGQVNNGAIDTKIATWTNMQNGLLTGVVIGGPTSVQQPVFDFRNVAAPLNEQVLPRHGIPERWDFPWMTYPKYNLAEPVLLTLEYSNGRFVVVPANNETTFRSNNTIATIEFNRTMNVTGWDTVTVSANPAVLSSNASLAYYGAGFIEGYSTAESLWSSFLNFYIPEFIGPAAFEEERQFIRRQLAFVQNVSTFGAAHPALAATPATGYAQQLAKLLSQIQGLSDGYNQYVSEKLQSAGGAGATLNFNMSMINFEDMYIFNLQFELWDIETYVNVTQLSRRPPRSDADKRPHSRHLHCSALIKPLPDMSDLYVSHSTWGGFNTMLRQYKTYNFEISLSMSSYPGYVSSTDDWYITSNGLTVMETTNGIFNMSLYRDYFSSSTVPEWMRVMAATYLATSAQQWQQIFVYLNSGSYNNQWMAVDMKLFSAGGSIDDLPDGLLWVSETIPGFYQMADVTKVIRDQGYWASYNAPYFPEIFSLSGNLWMERQFGTFYSYTKYARAEIFRRNQSMVTDLESMKRLMRYNDYLNDPLSDIPNCTGTIYNNTCNPKRSALLVIAARGDLDPTPNASTMGPLVTPAGGEQIGMQNEAQIDVKISTWTNMQSGRLIGVVTSGPTWDQQPPFSWSTAPVALSSITRHVAQPDRQAWGWVTYAPTVTHTVNFPAAEPPKPEVIVAAIIGSVGAFLALCIAAVVIWQNRSKSAESQPLVDGKDEI